MSGCFFFKHGVYFYLIFAWVFRTSWPKMGVLGGKIGEGVVRYWLPTNSCLLFGVLTSVSIWVKIDQEMWSWECSQTDRHTHTHTLTDANLFYHLSHAKCYSYGTDNNSFFMCNKMDTGMQEGCRLLLLSVCLSVCLFVSLSVCLTCDPCPNG